ncbi:hypothetical protein MMC07_007600 [Pseudocyphellaria aurata]|nr:hypothetical protein [Pseudocyphellaria aurata]
MILKHILTTSLTSLVLTGLTRADGLYTKGSLVLQVDGKSYDKLIAKSSQASILEFYAPWCGHCKNLKPAYEKAAKSLNGLAQVAAINCDEESNKAFCGGMGVQGFPTLKIIKPSKTPGKPTVEDYQGPRTATGIIDALKLAIPNHVKRISDKSLNGWFETSNDTTKAILFSEKGTTGALIKVLSAEFLGSIKIAQIRNKETVAVEMFGVSEFPSLVVLPGGSKEPVKYEGLFSKSAMKEFLAQYASPKSDSAPPKQKPLTEKSKKKKEDVKAKPEETKTEEVEPEEIKMEEVKLEEVKLDEAKPNNAEPEETQAEEKQATETQSEQPEPTSESSSIPSASSSHVSAEASETAADATSIILEDPSTPTESPDPIAIPEDAPKPVSVPESYPPIPALLEETILQKQCLGAKTTTCILALLPSAVDEETPLPDTANVALESLAELADKHVQRGGKLFPFYSIPAKNAAAATLRSALKLGDEQKIQLVAVNSRRGWWRHYKAEDFRFHSIETWVDNIRFGEGEKGKLPEGLILEEEEKPQSPPEHEEL